MAEFVDARSWRPVASVASAWRAPEEVATLIANHARREPHPDVDVATFVLASLDALLATQAELRRGLAPGRMTLPAERWHLAAASMVAARRYAAGLAAALGATRDDTTPAEPAEPAGTARLRRTTRIHRRTRRLPPLRA